MKNFIEQARSYSAYHQKSMTKYTHFAGIPLIILSLMIFFGFFFIGIINVISIDFATIGTLALIVYYFLLNWKLAIPLTPVLIFLLWISSMFSYAGPSVKGIWALIITFVLGLVLLLIGHFVGNRKAVFKDNVCQILLAPMFLMAELFFMANWLPELNAEIHGEIPQKETVNKDTQN